MNVDRYIRRHTRALNLLVLMSSRYPAPACCPPQMNGSRIASRSPPSSVSLPAQSLRAASSAGLLPAGHAATSPFAIDVASSWYAGLAVHAASAIRAIVYVGFIGLLTSRTG